jgi:nucleotide-binding universal stress UspA family protein
MYTKNLVPLDGSPRAEEILPYVVELALKYQSSVTLLQVVEIKIPADAAEFMPLPDGWELVRNTMEAEVKAAETYLGGVRFRLRAKGVDAQMRLAYSPVVKAIIAAADQEKADLIAMASHGRTGAAQVFYGSVASGLLHRIDRPLLIVRSQGRG